MVDVPVASSLGDGTVTTAAGTVEDATFYRCSSGREMVAGAASLDKDTCNGDSGGPLFVQSSDGNLYLAATTSRATGTPGLRPCCDGGIYVRSDGLVLQRIRSLRHQCPESVDHHRRGQLPECNPHGTPKR